MKERHDRKQKKILALKDETEGLDDEITELAKEQKEKEAELEETKRAQLEKREELMEKIKQEELIDEKA